MFNREFSRRARIASGAAVLALAFGPAYAQETRTQDQTGGAQQDQTQDQAADPQQGQAGDAQGQQSDARLATVGDVEVMASDIRAMLEAMPPRMRQQPREMLVPLALEQAVLRELILQQATTENLAEDPDVVSMVEGQRQIAEEDAMVGVWLQREMESRITDERVQEVYDRLASEATQEVPPLEAVRPQIEQQLGREAIQGISAELRDNISVVYYGPDGQPTETTAEAEPGTQSQGPDGEAGGGTTGDAGTTGNDGTTGAGDTTGNTGMSGDGDTTGNAGTTGDADSSDNDDN